MKKNFFLLALLRRLVDLFAIDRWSIRSRIQFGLVVLVFVTLIGTLLLLGRQVGQVDLENLQAFVTDRGEQTRTDLNGYFDRVRANMTFIGESSAFAPRLEQLLRSKLTSAPMTGPVVDYLDRQLVASNLFDEVMLFTLDGEVILSNTSTKTGSPVVATGTNIVDTQLFLSGENGATLSENQRITIDSSKDNFRVQFVQILYDQGEVMGYLGGTLNQATILDLMHNETEFAVQTRSYLTTVNGEMVTAEKNREAVERSFQVAPVSNALNGSVGLSTYRIDGREFAGFYARVDRSFALITEAPTDTTFTLTATNVYQLGTRLMLAALILAIGMAYLVSQSITLPLSIFEHDMMVVQNGEWDSPIHTAHRTDEIGNLGRMLAGLRDQFHSSLDALENSVRARSDYIDATQEVSRFAAAQRDIQMLMDSVVDLLVARFRNIYHAQIFLIDETRTWAVLRASTGEVGQRLLERGHRLEVGSLSVIGRVTSDGRVIVARDTAASEIHHRNEYLPETRAELAIPLRIGERAIGALDVQSRQSDSFTENQIRILQTMADQISVAIENARLYQEMIGRLEAVDLSNQQATLNSWREHLRGRRQGLISRQAGVPTPTDTSMLRQRVISSGKSIVGAQSENDTIPFAVPITLRGQILGAVEWELPVEAFSEHKVQLAQEMVNRLALSLENARLFQESTQAITRERLVNEIATRLTAQTNINDIMQTAVREVGQALRAPQVTIHVALDDEDHRHENGHGGVTRNSPPTIDLSDEN